jgi:hypothetical protein
LASNFNNDTFLRAADDRTAASVEPVESVQAEVPAVKPGEGPVTSDRPESAAFVRFRSCRWMQPAENGNQEFCTHREVKPYAGTQGFDADAWCPECQYYKLRRAPKKRNPADDYSY